MMPLVNLLMMFLWIIDHMLSLGERVIKLLSKFRLGFVFY